MTALDIQSLDRSGAVCRSWRDACTTFGVGALKQAPCLLYACDKYGPSAAALYCPSTNDTFRVPFPGPPCEKRGFVFSCNGLVFAGDEVGDPYLFNPITGAQAALPPVKTMNNDENFYDRDGKCVYECIEDEAPRTQISWARHSQYYRVAISTAAEVTNCTVLISHRPSYRLSYARPSDKQWTLLPDIIAFVDVLYNKYDGLFYAMRFNGSILALDLSGPSPSVTELLRKVVILGTPTQYLALGTSGDLLVVWREWDLIADSLDNDQFTDKDYMRYALRGCIDFAADDGNTEPTKSTTVDLDTRVSEPLDDEVSIRRKKLIELRDIEDHALILGFNAAICLPTKGLSGFEPNCAYLTDDFQEHSRTLRSDRGIWNIKTRSMTRLEDAWANLHSCLALPAPIWITPMF
jgi:hypothetical protein